MEAEQASMDLIFKQLCTKAILKQRIYKQVRESFLVFKKEVSVLAKELNTRVQQVDKAVVVEYNEVSEFEFYLKFSGDTLVFNLHSNVVTLPKGHEILEKEYVQANSDRAYMGNILVYNFMSDSIKYNRLEDSGYLIARILINSENHFFVEGVRQLGFMFADLEHNLLTRDWIRLIVEKCMLATIDMDLVAPPYMDIKDLTLGQKLNQNSISGRSKKVGFEMSYEK